MEISKLNDIFNLTDTTDAYITTGDIEITELYPDFPTGGTIINKKEISDGKDFENWLKECKVLQMVPYFKGEDVNALKITAKTPEELSRDIIDLLNFNYKCLSKTSIKDIQKLIARWYVAILIEWVECALVFRDEIINRGYTTEDELDAFVLQQYTKRGGLWLTGSTINKLEPYLLR